MASGTVAERTETENVGMGQVALAEGSARLGAVLGSCIGVALYHPRKQLGVFAHVVLPDSGGKTAKIVGGKRRTI